MFTGAATRSANKRRDKTLIQFACEENCSRACHGGQWDKSTNKNEASIDLQESTKVLWYIDT